MARADGAEGALIAADASIGIERQCRAATLAGGAHLKHSGLLDAVADPIILARRGADAAMRGLF